MATDRRAKGREFAYRCDIAISRWATSNRRSDLFYRGAGTTVVDAWDEPFARRFHLSFSHMHDLELPAVFFGGSGQISALWDAPLAEARKHDQELLSCVKQTRHPEMVLSTAETFEAFWRSSSGRLQVQFMFPRDGIVVHAFFLRQLLTRCDPELLMRQRAAVA